MSGGMAALAAVDKVLVEKPHKDDETLSHAMEQLCMFRDELIARRDTAGGAPDEAKRLSHLNAVISVVAGTHFPLGETPWDELEKARGWLAALLQHGG